MTSRDVLLLSVPMLNVGTDSYRIREEPQKPLTFDRVLENRPIASGCSLLNLPVEILSQITGYIAHDKQTLACLAFVNSDCRQIARSCQFAKVCCDYSPVFTDLMVKLHREQHQRQLNGGKTSQPSIGACIRRLEVATGQHWLLSRHGVGDILDENIPLSPGEKARRRRLGNADFYDNYIPALEGLLDEMCLPHLERVEWLDMIPLYPSFFYNLAKSSVRHLKLHRVSLPESFVLDDSSDLPLTSLDLELSRSMESFDQPHSTGPLLASLLRRCRRTLRTLRWEDTVASDARPPPPLTFGSTPTVFSELRTLSLDGAKMDLPAAEALLHAPLVSLTLTDDFDPRGAKSSQFQVLQEIGSMRYLQTLVWHAKIRHPRQLWFLRRNTHLQKLCICQPLSDDIASRQLLSLLASQFSHLRSLSLRWDDTATDIPDDCLSTIGAITSLEQLSLSSGCSSGWRHNWLIDHKVLQHRLRPLQHLRRLAFSRDSYNPFGVETCPDHYYEAAMSWDDRTIEDARLRPDLENVAAIEGLNTVVGVQRVFEQAHRNRMLALADEYARVLPELEWVLLGGLPVGIDMVSGQRQAVPLAPERDSCWTVLRQMFQDPV